MSLPIRDVLRGIAPYGGPQLDVSVRLNTNENPYPPSAELVADITAAVAGVAPGLNRYPDRDVRALRSELADYLATESDVKLDVDQIWAANGSNEIMLQLLQVFGGAQRRAVTFTPTYSMYAEYCRTTGTELVSVDRRDDFTIDLAEALEALESIRPSVVFVAAPNNPSGTALPLEQVRQLATATSAFGVLIIDEAYAEFRAPSHPSALVVRSEFDHVIVTRTMSKAFGLAGARLGYLAADPAVIDAIRLVRLPYHLSAVTQAIARAALAHAAVLRDQVALIRAERDATVHALRERGYAVPDSDANFVLVGHFPDSHAVWSGLVERGVLVREVGPPGWLRVSIGTASDNTAFRAALREVAGQ